jgi:DNA repair exonuclease SbcCD nuclease subunit
MKVVFIGDPHHKWTKFDLGCQFLDWVTETVINEKPDMVVNLGDHFDSHGIVRTEIQKVYRQHVSEITSHGINYVHLLGNHEWHKNGSKTYHALQVMKELENSTYYIVDEPVDLFGMTFVPYTHDLNEFPKVTLPICIAHQTFIGADYGYHRPDAGVDAADVSAEIIISGHVHKRQTFGRVTYPGTPYAQSVNDINQAKGIMVFDTETYKMSYIDSPFPTWRGAKFEMSLDMHDEIVTKVSGGHNDHWIVDISGPKAEVNAYLSSKEFKGLKVDVDIKVRATHTDTQKTILKIQAITMSNILAEYVDKVYDGALDKETIKAKAFKILEKARQA